MTTPEFAAFEMNETQYEVDASQASKVPKVLEEFLAAKGMEAKSISSRPDLSLPKYRMRGFHPLLASTLPTEILRQLDYEPPTRNNDELRLGDSILVVRSVGAGKYWEDAEKHRARAVMGQSSLADEQMVTEEINQRARRALGRPALILEETELSRRPASAHVRGGDSSDAAGEFNQEVRDELKRRREEIPD